MRRRPLLIAVLVALACALIGALGASEPVAGIPVVALRSMLVWRLEVGAVVFAVGYGAIVTARLAFHGHTFTRVGSGGIEIPPVGSADAASDETRAVTRELEISVAALQAIVGEMERRLLAIEDPSHLLLSPQEEEI